MGGQRVEQDFSPSWLVRFVGVVTWPITMVALLVPTRRGRARRHALAVQTAGDPARRARHARAALAAFEAAERRRRRRPPSIWHQQRRAASLPDITMAALEAGELAKAAALADEMLAMGMGPVAPGNWNAGNLIHYGHATLGRLALKAGDVDAAEEHLRLAGSVHGSPQLDSFGPDFGLANELLAGAGRRWCWSIWTCAAGSGSWVMRRSTAGPPSSELGAARSCASSALTPDQQ
jgi:hypothetical protein